ncbi:MAG: RDD family protein [Gammaproteobacteria bacterium]
MWVVTAPLNYLLYGSEYFTSGELYYGIGDLIVNFIFPLVAIMMFWHYKGATPGKMAFNARIVDARDGSKLSAGQIVGRYFGYIPSFLVVGLGCVWIGWDARKQGWHDKLAGTVVVRPRRTDADPVKFGG